MFQNPFAAKKSSITLSKALELRELLEDKLKKNHGILKLENSVTVGQKRNYNLKKIVKESETLREQLITLKLIIQKANLVIPENEKFCISYYVYLLSEKKIEIANLTSMLKTAFKGPYTNKENQTVTLAEPVFTRPEIEDWINKLKKECRAIEDGSLTSLNNSIIVELPFKTDLV
jgi:hypothetical protein